MGACYFFQVRFDKFAAVAVGLVALGFPRSAQAHSPGSVGAILAAVLACGAAATLASAVHLRRREPQPRGWAFVWRIALVALGTTAIAWLVLGPLIYVIYESG